MNSTKTLIVLAGLPGVGKSYTCKIIREKIDCYFFDSDEFAKKSTIFKGVDFKKITKDELDNLRLQFYYTKIVAIKELFQKYDVIVFDAIFERKKFRQLFYDLMKQITGKMLIIEVVAPEELVRKRILTDSTTNRVSTKPEDRINLYEKLKKDWQPIQVPFWIFNVKHYVIDSSDEPNMQINKILTKEKLIKEQ